jgi:hypothetical protein
VLYDATGSYTSLLTILGSAMRGDRQFDASSTRLFGLKIEEFTLRIYHFHLTIQFASATDRNPPLT